MIRQLTLNPKKDFAEVLKSERYWDDCVATQEENKNTLKGTKTILLAWLIDFNSTSNYLGSFYALRLGNHIHSTFIFRLIVVVS